MATVTVCVLVTVPTCKVTGTAAPTVDSAGMRT
jgi:hypothetical protein